MTQTSKNGTAVAPACPMSSTTAVPVYAAAMPHRLMRVSEVARDYPADSPLARVLLWMREFLSHPHPDLGRKGAVCPFVPVSLGLDTIWLAEVTDPNPRLEDIAALITHLRRQFLVTEPVDGPDAINKAFVVAFPYLGPGSTDLVDRVQNALRTEFIDCGLMLGEFHETNQSAGLRNAQFRPLRSPIPMLGMRHMVDSDLPFLQRANLPAQERASFLRAYLFRLAGSLNAARFDQALNGLIDAEIEKRAPGHTGDDPATCRAT